MLTILHLGWADVDPATNPYDPERIAAVVDSALPATAVQPPKRDEKRKRLQDDVGRSLLASEAPWISGWQWSVGGGGIADGYCCPGHSLRGSPEEMRGLILGGVSSLRSRLEELARRFEQWDDEVEGLDEGAAARRIAPRLLPLAVEWTREEDAWYRSFERMLAWALERRGIAPPVAEVLVREAIGGRFESWSGPADVTARAVFDDLATLTRERRERPPVDALAAWLSARGHVRWDRARHYDPDPVRRDGHRRFIEETDRARDPARADDLLAALSAARADARAGRPLTLERLTRWQSLVLGEPVAFRTEVAFAHGGAERYGLEPDTEPRFAACLEQANGADATPTARAARAYLDVCFFHPFPDGNARAARLALDYVLTRAGLALHAAAPVFVVARRADDHLGPYGFMLTIDYLSGPIGWR
ncbi:MAG: Fic family protein [Myxococcota bacterium]|nr:Fic family protein [Myxococcota bacterium]